MGKYMRKCKGAAGEEQAVGVRTRSRAAAGAGAGAKVVVSKRRRPPPPSPLKAAGAATAAAAESVGVGESGSCYLKLRSRMLFMAPPPSTPAPVHGPEVGHGAPLAAGLSRCSSTASSLDASSAAQADRTLPCRSSDAAEVRGNFEFSIEANPRISKFKALRFEISSPIIPLLKILGLNLVSVLEPQAGSDNVRQQGSASNSSDRKRWGDRNSLAFPANSAELCFLRCS
jgi:hypothetical protein